MKPTYNSVPDYLDALVIAINEEDLAGYNASD